MSNPLFQQLGGGRAPGPAGNMQDFMARFNQFRANFQGDPRQKVQELLNSGQMTQQQYNQLRQQAEQIQRMLGQR